MTFDWNVNKEHSWLIFKIGTCLACILKRNMVDLKIKKEHSWLQFLKEYGWLKFQIIELTGNLRKEHDWLEFQVETRQL